MGAAGESGADVLSRRAPLRRRVRLRARSSKRAGLVRALVELRNAVLTRDQHRCRYCRTQYGPLDVHHAIKRSQAPHLLLDPDNATTLCRTCHDWTDAPYGGREGRLCVDVLGAGLFAFSVVHAANKFAVNKPVNIRWIERLSANGSV